MSRRRGRTLTKAQARPSSSPALVGTVYSAEQVVSMMRATAAASGGQAAMPLPRLDPPVPFGPGMPLNPSPINPINPATGRAAPRAWEYPVTWNMPGFGDRLIPWKVLRDASNMIPLFRRCIEIRKAEVATLDWDVTISAKAIERAQRQDPNSARSVIEKSMRERVDPHIGRLVDFWESPDRRNGLDFIGWASKVLEEYFAIDAIAVYPRATLGGDLYAFEVLDGTTIKPLLDQYGNRPLPPQAAYQQILYGFPRGEFIADLDSETGQVQGGYPADRLVYKVHNVRSYTPYGFSAVEQALYDGELYLRRMGWLKAEYTEGAMPAGWLKTGAGQAEWTPQQLAEYERALNDYYAGNTAARQRWRILPWGMEPQESTDLNERYRPDYDLHLIKLVSSHFDTTIAELGFTEVGGLGSTGWHEGQADVQDRKATQPTLRRLQAFCTALMRVYLNAPRELEFRILGLESEDEDAADEVAGRRVGNGRMTLNEDRDRTGLPRYNFAEADKPMLVTQRGVVFLEGASTVAPPGTMVGPAEAVPEGGPQQGSTQPGDEPGDDEQDDSDSEPPAKSAAGKPTPEVVKAELVAYRRWLTKGKLSRPFRFATITKADAERAGVDLAHAEFVGKAEGEVAGRAPKVRHWPGWERDLAVAAHWAPKLLEASTGLVSAETLASEAAKVYAKGGRQAVARALAHWDYAAEFLPVLRGLWTDGYVVGTLSARSVLAHHGIAVTPAQTVKADEPVATLTMGTDWGGWSPGDELAARQVLEREGAIDGLLSLLDTGDTVADGIMVTRLERLAGVLTEGLARGDSPAKIAQALRPILDSSKWAHLVAITETTRAVSAATLLRYRDNGIEAKEWWTAADQRVCPECNENESVGAVGLAAGFPDGNSGPPAHPGCRCSLAPVILTESQAQAEGIDVSPPLFGGADLAQVGMRAAEDILSEVEGEEAAEVAEAEVAETAPIPPGDGPLPNREAKTIDQLLTETDRQHSRACGRMSSGQCKASTAPAA